MQIASLTLLLTGPVSWSITCGFSKSRECWLKMACSAAADMSKRPFLMYDELKEPAGDFYFANATDQDLMIDFFFRESSRSYWLDYKNGWFLESVANLKMAGATHAETSFWHKPAGAVRSCCNNEFPARSIAEMWLWFLTMQAKLFTLQQLTLKVFLLKIVQIRDLFEKRFPVTRLSADAPLLSAGAPLLSAGTQTPCSLQGKDTPRRDKDDCDHRHKS